VPVLKAPKLGRIQIPQDFVLIYEFCDVHKIDRFSDKTLQLRIGQHRGSLFFHTKIACKHPYRQKKLEPTTAT
jgi:hypothetical protein